MNGNMKSKISTALFFTAVPLLAIIIISIFIYTEKNNSELPYYGNSEVANSFSEANKKNIIPVPDFSFTNQDDKIINQNFIKNKVWVTNFFFTHCGTICPKMSSNLKDMQKEFSANENVKIISFTCDPLHDNAEQLFNYSESYIANNNQWQFATGNKQLLYRFARKGLQLVATDGDGGPNDFIHSQNLVLVDKQGYIRGYYDGTDAEQITQLISDIKKLL
jgi:protein SCO1